MSQQQSMPEISAIELKERLDNGDDIQIIDVREANEVAVAKLPNAVHIPLAQVINRMSEIDPNRETVVHCKMGGRSARAIQALKQSGFTGNLLNLKGGITAWSNDDRWSKWFADLPPLGETPVAFLIARRPSPPRAAAAGSKLDPQKAMKAIAALTLDRITSTVLENRSNLLLISTSSGHYIHNDEPELTIDAIRRVVNIAAGKK